MDIDTRQTVDQNKENMSLVSRNTVFYLNFFKKYYRSKNKNIRWFSSLIHFFCFIKIGELGRVVRKPVNANPGLKVNRGKNFVCTKVLSIAKFLCSFRLVMLKAEGQKI